MSKKLFIPFFSLFLILEIFFIFNRGVWAPDEARYARVTYEMKEKKSYIIPYLNGEIYSEKPPLFFDISILFSIGNKEVPHYAVKVTSLFASLLVLFFSLLVAKKLGIKESFYVPLTLLSMPKFLWQSQFGQIDMLLTATILIQFYFALKILMSEGGIIDIIFLSLFSFLGTITKGPVSFVPLFIFILLYLIYIKRYRLILKYLLSLIFSLIFIFLWLYVAYVLAGREYINILLFKQTLTRYFEPWHHYAPFYYYFLTIWIDAFPISLFLIPALIYNIKNQKFFENGRFLVLLFIVVFIVFLSISSGKRSIYLLPLFPFISIYMSYAIEDWNKKYLPQKMFLIFSYIVLLLQFILLLYFVVFRKKVYKMLNVEKLEGEFFFYLLICSSIILFLIFVFKSMSNGKFEILFLSLSFILPLYFAIPLVKEVDRFKVPYCIISSLKPFRAFGLKIGVYPKLIPQINYYLKTNTDVIKKEEEEKVTEFLEKGGVLIARESALSEKVLEKSYVVLKENIGDEPFLLLIYKELTTREGQKSASGT